MMEWLVTASPEFFYEKTEKEIEKWANAQVDFMRKEFGQQLKLGILHLDEKTPHIHFMVSTEQFTEKKYKNQKGEFFKKTWSLNAKRYNPDFLVKLQDRFALANKRFGLYRGARGSKKKNLPLKDFYKVVDTIKEIDMKPVVEHYLKDVAIDVPLWKRTESYLKELFIEAISPILKKLVNDHNKLRKFVETNWVDLQEKIIKEKADAKLLLDEVKKEKQSLDNLKSIYLPKINNVKILEEQNRMLVRENERLMAKEVKRRERDLAKSMADVGGKTGKVSHETTLKR